MFVIYALFLLNLTRCSLVRFEKNVLGQWRSGDIAISNQPILFDMAPMGTPLSIPEGECPWRLSLRRPSGPSCVQQFTLGRDDSVHLPLAYSLVEEAYSIASAKADIFGIPDLLAQVSIVASLRFETSILELQFLPRKHALPVYMGNYIPWTVSKYGWYLGDKGSSLNTDATRLDMSIEGISFPPNSALTFLGTKLAVIKEGIVWIHRSFIVGQKLNLKIANDRWIRIPLVSLCAPVPPDTNGYHRCHITIRPFSVRKSTAHVFIGETLFQHVNRVKFDHYGDMEIEEIVMVPFAPIKSTSLRHLPIFHPPVPHTDMWGDSTLRLYPAKFPLPVNSRLKGVVIPKGPYDFHYLGPATEYDFEYDMAGFDAKIGPWVQVYTVGGNFFLEKKVLTGFMGWFSLVSALKGGHTLEWSIQPAQWANRCTSREDGDCVICMEKMIDRKAVIDGCGHCFHRNCIREWASKQANCPSCRGSLERTFSIPAALVRFTKMMFRDPALQVGFLLGIVGTRILGEEVSFEKLLYGGALGVIMVSQIQRFARWIFPRLRRFRTYPSPEMAFENLSPEMASQVQEWAQIPLN